MKVFTRCPFYIKGSLPAFACLFAIVTEAQQNLFNVPSSDIVERKKLFYQQQWNFTHDLVQFNTTFSYGLGHNSEIGVNVISFDLNRRSSGPRILANNNPNQFPEYPFYTLNFQKAFELSGVLNLTIGTQSGLTDKARFGSYVYSNMVAILPRSRTKIITGLYWGSDSFFGNDSRSYILTQSLLVGTQIGVEQPVFKEKVFLIAENISGTHSLGETSLGAAWKFSKRWLWSMAYQFPNPSGKSAKALVLELTFVPLKQELK